MEKNKTAVEWLFQKLWDEPKDKFTWYALREKAIQMEKEQVELRYKDGTPMRKYNSSKLQELKQINQDNPITRGSTALVRVTSSQTEISDEEIEKFASDFYDSNGSESIFIMGAKWYREQFKKNI